MREQIINNTLNAILERIKDELKEITEKEVYFWDIAHEEIDSNTPQDNQTALKFIEETNLLQYVDEGLIDNSSLNRQLVTSAYCCLEQALINNDFFQYLQEKLNNETINKKQAREIIKKIEEYQKEQGFKKVEYEDTKTQVFLSVDFDFSTDDFKQFVEEGYLKEEQLINLSDGVKILTSNKAINNNAMVLEKKRKGLIRFYLMDIDKDMDIRNLLKPDSISKETGFILSPRFYLEQTTEEYEQDKKFKRFNYLKKFSDKENFLKFMVRISQKLTEKSIKGINKTNIKTINN